MAPWEEIKAKINLVDYVSQYVKLVPSGKSFKGLCPFHKEKTPSFFVSPEKQIWHCFGCHRGGDLFKFVMEQERLEFVDALRLLADKAGIVLKREDPQLTTLRSRLYEALKMSAQFFCHQFAQNRQALNYMLSRGLEVETLNLFQIGYAPASWHTLYLYLRQLGFSDLELEQAGLVIKSVDSKNKLGYYDRFRNRIMFPIFDQTGRVVGFSGRILPFLGQGREDSFSQTTERSPRLEEAKYINTPETLVYSKSKFLYGLYITQEEIKNQQKVFLVEGNIDVLMGWQNGLKNIVAVSGTALTENQLSLLKRFCHTLILGFDMDTAGEMATDRSIALASQHGFTIKIVQIPEGKDLADYFQAYPHSADKLLAHSQEIMQYYFSLAFQKEPKTVEEKKKVVQYLLPRIKSLLNVVEQNVWLEQLATKIGVASKMLLEEMERVSPLTEIRFADEKDTSVAESLFFRSRWERLAERILAFVLRFPDQVQQIKGNEAYFPYRFQEYARLLSSSLEIAPEKLEEEFGQEFVGYLYLLAEHELSFLSFDDPSFIKQELQSLILALKKEKIRNDLREIAIGIQEAEIAANHERVAQLSELFSQKTKEFAELEHLGV